MRVFLSYIESELKLHYDGEERGVLGRLLLQHFTGMTRTQTFTDKDRIFPRDISELLRIAVDRLKKGEPIQYILGQTEFAGLPFHVRPGVLIPRPETEELAEWVLEDSTKKIDCPEIRILDIGTGSGCLAIFLAASLKHALVEAWDVSEEALAIATENAQLNKVDVHFVHQNVLRYKVSPEEMASLDVIVSNPPYVLKSEQPAMKERVYRHEPNLALFVEDADPLIFYRVLGELASQRLKAQGSLYVEINGMLGAETVALLKTFPFSSVELRKDLSGKERMIKATR